MAGIDHSRATIEYRERFSFTRAGAAEALRRVRDEYGVPGAVILSTCNRTELWLSGGACEPPAPAALLCALKGAAPAEYGRFLTGRDGEDAARHLLATSCGLNSRVFGEDQIVTQVGEALALSRAAGCADSVLERLFRTAVTAAKRVKTSVRLTTAHASTAARVAQLLRRELGQDLAGVPCLVIGNGAMGRLAASALVASGCRVTMTLRQYKGGGAVVPPGCETAHYDERFALLGRVRVVVSATASPHHTLKYEDTLPHLTGAPLLLVDLAVPRDVSPRLGREPGVALYDIDSLGGAPPEAAGAVERANRILDAQLREFADWYEFRGLAPGIRRIGARAAGDAAARVEREVSRLPLPQAGREELLARIGDASDKAVRRVLYGLRETLDRGEWERCVRALEEAADRPSRALHEK